MSQASPMIRTCGSLIVGGFDGASLPPSYARALAEGRRGGAILFRRNLPNLELTAELCASLAKASGPDFPPFVGVDQEGGRVARLSSPFLRLPPMRSLGALGDAALVERVARALGRQLSALGFNLDFAPVLDVDSNPANPIIGDRSFSREPREVARLALAFARGLQAEGVLACGKHYPGHGDTEVDSHVGLPRILHAVERLERVELFPFRAAAEAGTDVCATLMTAHVVCEAVDPGVPATLSHAFCTELLRTRLGFEGALFSDDLEMAAVASLASVEELAVRSVRAGCDVLLICKSEELQDRALEALVREAERDPSFARRCEQAAARSLQLRRRWAPRPPLDAAARYALFESPEASEVYEAHGLVETLDRLIAEAGPSRGAPVGEGA